MKAPVDPVPERKLPRGLVLRFGDADGHPDPLYGYVLQNQAVPGMMPEGRIVLTSATATDGPETGVRWVQCLRGDAVWNPVKEGLVQQELFDAAFALVSGPLDPTDHDRGNEPTLFLFQYNDGLLGAVADDHPLEAACGRDVEQLHVRTVEGLVIPFAGARPLAHEPVVRFQRLGRDLVLDDALDAPA